MAARELRLDEQLLGSDAELGQVLRLGVGPRFVGELGVRLPLPERERRAQPLARRDRVLPVQGRATGHDVRLELGDVEAEAAERQLVARRPGDHDVPEHPAQPRHIAAHGRGRRLRRLSREHDIRDPIHRHDRVAVDQQNGEQASLPSAAEPLLDSVTGDPDRAEGVNAQLLPGRLPVDLESSHRPPPNACHPRKFRMQPLECCCHAARAVWQSCGRRSSPSAPLSAPRSERSGDFAEQARAFATRRRRCSALP